MAAPRLGLIEFFRLAASLGITEVEIRNDLEGRPIRDGTSPEAVGAAAAEASVTIVSINIPADRRPVVEYTFTDDANQPLDRLGQVTPGSLSVNQVLAWWDPVTRYYTAYTTRVQTSSPNAPHPNVQAIQPAAAHVEGEGRRRCASQSGTAAIQKTVAMMKPVSAMAAKLPGTTRR